MRAALAAALLWLAAGAAAAQDGEIPDVFPPDIVLPPIEAPPAALPADESASRDPAEAPAGVYQLDPRHASVIWRVRHTGVGVFVGRFDTIAGTLVFDPERPERSSIEASVETASVNTGVLNRNGERAFDRTIAEVLGAAAGPQIRFVSRVALAERDGRGLLEGDLTMNGRTHPVVFEVTFQGGRFVALRGKHVLAFSARTVIDRRQWEVGSLSFNQFAGDPVEIVIEAEFVKD